MNTVLDVLKLRRVRLDYVSPPICQVILSGSGSSMMLEAAQPTEAPFNLALNGQCERFLTWTAQANVFCTSLYTADNPSDPLTKYQLTVDCLPTGSINVCSPGWWQYSTLTADGLESARSEPVLVVTGTRVSIPIVRAPGAVRFNLFRNVEQGYKNGTYSLVLSSVSFGVYELCEIFGCYRLLAISEDGASDLSAPICHTTYAGCIPSNFASVLCPESFSCVGQPYSSVFEAVGGTPPFLWEIASGTPPAGITIHTGLFSGQTAPVDGTPTETGNFPVTIRATSADGNVVEKECFFSVFGLAEYGTVILAPTDTAFSQALTPSGGTGPYSYALTSGALPSGYSLSAAGVISGTAYFGGVYSFSVTVTDSVGVSCVVPLTLEITECPAATSFPTITWNPAELSTAWPVLMVLDSQRRNLVVELANAHAAGITLSVDIISSITKTYAGVTYPDTGAGNTFGTSWIGYEPVNDIIAIASRTGNWTRLDPATGLYTQLGAQSPQIGRDNVLYPFAVDTKRGQVMGTRSASPAGFQIVEITKSTFTSKHSNTTLAINVGTCDYSAAIDKYVIVYQNNNPPFFYVDPVTYGMTDSTVNSTSGALAAGRYTIYSLQGTPWVVYMDSAKHIAIVDVTTDTMYWNDTAHTFVESAINNYCYNSCTGVLYAFADGFIWSWDVPAKTYLNRIVTPTGGSAYSTVFDPAANLIYVLNGNSPADTPKYIYTI